jgi:DNA-binding LacI/PurR family transcriptional regulator
VTAGTDAADRLTGMDGREEPEVLRVTMDDVAQLAGVSRATVSRVLAGTARVSDTTQEKVLAAITRLGYVPNMMAQALATRGSSLVGLLLRDPRKASYGLLHSALQSSSGAAGLELITVAPTASEGAVEERRALQKLLGLRVGGLFVATGVIRPEDLTPFLSVVPVVSVGRPETHPRIHGVSYDEEATGRQIADAVLAQGHRDVAVLITAWDASIPEHARGTAIADRLRQRGARVSEFRTEHFAARAEHSEAIADLVQAGGATAALFPTDERALDLLRECRVRGLRVPEDVSVTGADGIAVGLDQIGLATVRIPVEQVAARAVAVMADLLAGTDLPVAHETFPGEFVPGRTLGPAPDRARA